MPDPMKTPVLNSHEMIPQDWLKGKMLKQTEKERIELDRGML